MPLVLIFVKITNKTLKILNIARNSALYPLLKVKNLRNSFI